MPILKLNEETKLTSHDVNHTNDEMLQAMWLSHVEACACAHTAAEREIAKNNLEVIAGKLPMFDLTEPSSRVILAIIEENKTTIADDSRAILTEINEKLAQYHMTA